MEIPIAETDEIPPHQIPSKQFQEQINNIEKFFEDYKLKQNIFTKQQLFQQDHFSFVKGSNFMYIGGILQQMKHGFGVYITPNTVYEGFFKLGLKMGKGYIKFSFGAIYIGDFVNNKPHGYGILTYPNSESYTGQFQNAIISGNGMWISALGDRYIGQWKNNKADGNGIYIWANGDKYEGQFRQFLKHGYGIQKFVNGDIYKGHYEGGKQNGYGQYTWKNKSQYKGEFKSGLKNGKGVWKRNIEQQQTDTYQGTYQNDKKSGFGIFKWKSGNYYKGQFLNDLRHGQGQMYWSDGSYYKGSWQKGIQNGRGRVSFLGSPQRQGMFQNNILITEHKPQFQSNISYTQNITPTSRKHASLYIKENKLKIIPQIIIQKKHSQEKRLKRKRKVPKIDLQTKRLNNLYLNISNFSHQYSTNKYLSSSSRFRIKNKIPK